MNREKRKPTGKERIFARLNELAGGKEKICSLRILRFSCESAIFVRSAVGEHFFWLFSGGAAMPIAGGCENATPKATISRNTASERALEVK